VSAFFDVDLKEISEVIERRAGVTKPALLFNGSRFGIALGYDDAAQGVAKFSRHFLIGGLAVVVAETDFGVRVRWYQKDAPTVIRHLDVIEMRPAVRLDADSRSEIHILLLKAVGSHLLPPVEIVRQPLFERPLQAHILS